jgi:hypothetical protein
MTLTLEQRQQRDGARKTLREIGKAEKANRPAKVAHERAFPGGRPARINHQRTKPKGGREVDPAFMRWQHESGLTCIACAIEGPPSVAMLQGERNPIEVAHQRVGGWKKGVRGDDKNSAPLCRWHHQLAPNACDKGQRHFWQRLGVGENVGAFCAALHDAYTCGRSGQAVIDRFVQEARRCKA